MLGPGKSLNRYSVEVEEIWEELFICSVSRFLFHQPLGFIVCPCLALEGAQGS